MADNKKYLTHALEHGSVMISDDVVAAIVINALKDVEGVSGLTSKLGTDAAALKSWNKGLKVAISENNDISVDCNIVVTYGQSVILVAQNAQDAISAAIANMTGFQPTAVNVNVCGIAR